MTQKVIKIQKEKQMLLFYIRHGEPIYDPDSLTPLGEMQAEAVSKRLSLHGIDRIFASTSRRAIQTAEPTSSLLNKEITLLDFCNELYMWRDFSVETEEKEWTWIFRDKRYRRLFADRAFAMNKDWYKDERLKTGNFEKGIKRVNNETDKWLSSLGYDHDREACIYKAVNPTDERIALFAHQGFGIAFLSAILDIPFPMFSSHFDMGHSDITVIEFESIEGVVIPKILTLSNDGHLYRENLPTKYNHKWEF